MHSGEVPDQGKTMFHLEEESFVKLSRRNTIYNVYNFKVFISVSVHKCPLHNKVVHFWLQLSIIADHLNETNSCLAAASSSNGVI